ncbi:MAG: hypothetical protein ACI94Y_003618 [Maribacter sp.]|jgi:hypothetical protein
MKKVLNIIVINLIVILSTNNALAQESNLLLGGSISTGISNLFYTRNHNPTTPSLYSHSNPNLGYEFDFIIEYSMNSKIGIQAGVKYSNWGHNSNKVSSSVYSTFPNAPDSFHRLYIKDRYSFMEIPLRLNYYLGKNKNNRFAIAGGISPSFGFWHKTSTIFINNEGSVISKRNNAAKGFDFNIVSEIGVIWNKAISEKIIFFIYPNFRIQLMTKGGDRRTLYSGLSTGIKLRL